MSFTPAACIRRQRRCCQIALAPFPWTQRYAFLQVLFVTLLAYSRSLAATYPAQRLAWEVRYLCKDLLPHSETRLLAAGSVLLRSLGQESDLSLQHKNEETRLCSELFIMLAREILLKDAIGVEELEGPCRILHL